jgi:glycosyltransferase involved in cell wall biosynthesis
VKVAVVVQRYGAEINGGAELHARYVAEHLARHVQVEVLTTCATDYVTWRNALPTSVETIHNVTVRRFPVARERNPDEFGRWSERVFQQPHSFRDELSWLDAEGPTSPELIAYITQHEPEFDFFIFFSFRYYHSYHGVRAVPGKAILVPTAERDGALGLAIFGPILRGARAIMYNSFEERALIHGAAANADVPGVVVGIGSEIPDEAVPSRFRQKFNFRDRFAIYIGRIDENKGCAELFDFFQRYSRAMADGMHLVLIGTPIIPIPDHPRIHHLGFVNDQDKFDALAAAELLIMPSYLESLSMVALEAWALGKPVLANGKCDVLRGQCIRSNGGLYYENFDEFLETLRAIDIGPALQLALGRNGRDYFGKHYSWQVIEKKYLDMLERLRDGREKTTAALESIPGWFARRRRTLPPAHDIVVALPTGPALRESEKAVPAAASRPVDRAPAPVLQPMRPAPRPEAGIEAPRADAPRGPRIESRPQSTDRRRPPMRSRRPPQQQGGAPPAQPPPASNSAGAPRQGRPDNRGADNRGPRRPRRGGGPPRKPNDK